MSCRLSLADGPAQPTGWSRVFGFKRELVLVGFIKHRSWSLKLKQIFWAIAQSLCIAQVFQPIPAQVSGTFSVSRPSSASPVTPTPLAARHVQQVQPRSSAGRRAFSIIPAALNYTPTEPRLLQSNE
jgi:hypothetical protein